MSWQIKTVKETESRSHILKRSSRLRHLTTTPPTKESPHRKIHKPVYIRRASATCYLSSAEVCHKSVLNVVPSWPLSYSFPFLNRGSNSPGSTVWTTGRIFHVRLDCPPLPTRFGELTERRWSCRYEDGTKLGAGELIQINSCHTWEL